jgi:hypothetical protein
MATDAHPRHFTKTLGWGDIAAPAYDGCVADSTVGITDAGTVSTLYAVGMEMDAKHVFHAIATK